MDYTREEILLARQELLDAGMIEPTGETRGGQEVHRITEKGKHWIARGDVLVLEDAALKDVEATE